jgi:hypothetical protein
MLNTNAIINLYKWSIYSTTYGLSNRDTTDVEKNTAEAFSFKTREEYLEWVKEWKAEYKKISEQSRGYKKARKLHGPAFNDLFGRDAQMEVMRLRRIANAMLWARKEAKKRSWEMKQKRDEERAIQQMKLHRISLQSKMYKQ